MNVTTIERDIKLCCMTAASFPDGILAAHQKLHAKLPFLNGRNFFGISRPSPQGTIVYKAAVEEAKEGEADSLGLESLVLPKGRYVYLDVLNYHDDIPAIGKAFQRLLDTPDIDPQGWCVERYLNDTDVRCMTRLAKDI